MANTFDLDPTRYVRAPILDVAGAIALGISLLTAHQKVAKELPTTVKRAAKQLRQAVVDLQTRWDGQRVAALASDEDKRPADQREDRAFGALAMRIEALTLLPENLEIAQRAQKLYSRLFPGGLAFLKLPYERQWAECEQRLRDIGDGAIADEVTELAGEEVLQELRAAHKNYGRALGITSARENNVTAPKVAEQLRTVQQAISDYALQLVASARSDADVAAAAVSCLRPLDALREADARRGGGRTPETDSTTTAPTPEASTVTPNTPVPTFED